jgi:hypothetical protein
MQGLPKETVCSVYILYIQYYSKPKRDDMGTLEYWPGLQWVVMVEYNTLLQHLDLTVARSWAAPARVLTTALTV